MKKAPIYNSLDEQYTEDASPEIIVGQIKNISVRGDDLKPLMTIKLKDGTFHHNVETISSGGTNGFSYVHMPLEIGGFVYCLKTYENAPIFCIGGAIKPKNMGFETGLSVASVFSDRKTNNVRDLILQNDDNKINLTHLNGLVLDSEKMIRMQLGENGVLRISRFGRVGDNILDGSKFIDLLFDYISVLEEKINQHSAWINNASPIVNQQFTAAAGVHAQAALAATNSGNAVLAASEGAEADLDTQRAADTLTLGATAGVDLTPTAAEEKQNVRKALNPYVQTPIQDDE